MAERFSKETAQLRTYRAFEAVIAADDTAIDLVQAALLIASIAYPELDMAHYIAQLDSLAGRVRSLLELPPRRSEDAEEIDAQAALNALNQVLFTEEQFHGNQADYMNPENSFFNRVLEERTGIPITLSLLYIEVGRRVGIQIEGVGLPYHFMVRCRLPERNIYIDPFEGGLFFSQQECKERIKHMVEQITGGRVRLHAHWFAAVTHRQFLFRMLNNLKHIYLHNEDYARALPICNLLILLMPQLAQERRDRGIVHLQLKHYARALHDLKVYLEFAPEAKDRTEMEEHIKSIRQIMALLN
jgi:regulator of sirC expression with transglutaminase-like and TPR domain